LIENKNLEGAFNLTSPQPIRNRDFFQTVASALKKPCIFKIPEFALKIAFGEMADEVFLASQKVYPKKLLAAGFKFKNPDLKTTLESMNLKDKDY
jgi:NAD dependent epimerase/dehydratase family enzyme